MINLIVAYYENIGPFKDTCCSLIFDEGKYLIKAPIGSGKSFLFFDAPRYALYKDSNRNMLNLQSKNGEISLIFENDGSYYLIKRILKRTSAGNDSCSSQLFTISYDGENLLKDIKNLCGNKEILQWGENIIEKFESQNKKLWEISEKSFKNEGDLKGHMEGFLPPKEVFLSTIFLLQDADNIFDMKPSERLVVLKNVFNLLGIDDVKDKIQEKKSEVSSEIKFKSNTSEDNLKLRSALKNLWNTTKRMKNDNELTQILSENDDFFDPIEQSFDKLTVNEFTLNGFDKNAYEKAEQIIQKRIEIVIKLDAQLTELQNQASALNQQKFQVSKDIQTTKDNISDLQKRIENIDSKKGSQLKEKKIELYKKGDDLNSNARYSDFFEVVEFWNKSAENDDSFEKLEMPKDLKSAYDTLQVARAGGKRLKDMIESGITKLEYIDLQSKRWNENHDREIEKLKDLKSKKEDEIKLQQTRIVELDKMQAKNSDFDCPDLCKKCPYINEINKQQFDQYSQKKKELNQTLETMKSEYEKQDFDNKIKELENQKNPEGGDQKKDLEKKIKEQTDFSDTLKEYLMKLEFSKWENEYKEWDGIQKEIQSIDKELFQREEESKNLEKYQQDKVAAETSLQHLQKSLQEQEKLVEDLNLKIEGVKSEKEKSNGTELEQQQKDIKLCSQSIIQLEELVEGNAKRKVKLKELEEKYSRLSNLYTIFSSKLILIALSNYLPILSDVINSYLSQCVDYILKMQIVENDGKIELEANIIDSKGEREVKSLSGGQRTVLKLVRMLAVSSYLNTPLLFLDETINNLDADTVGKVSEMINNFVKQRTMKFYTVTHNKEIQDMQIWDDVIEVNGIEKS